MSALFFAIQTEVVCIDFFGFPVAILKEWWEENMYLAIDKNASLYMFSQSPYLGDTMWLLKETSDAFSNFLLDLGSYSIEGLRDWVNDNWDKQVWYMQDFPIWSRQ